MQGLIFASVAASAAIVIILLLRKFFKDKVFSKVFVMLWALVIFRLLIPFEFSSALSIYPYETKVSAPSAENNVQIQWGTLPQYDETAFITEYEPAEEPAKPIVKISSAEVFFIIWLIGAVSSGGYFTLRHFYTVKKIKADCAPFTEFPEDFFPENTLFLKSKNIASPLSFGVFRPTAVIPEGVPREQLPFVLLHEHTHIKNRDAALKAAAGFALSLNWFNPLVWVAVKYLDRDIERYCDERVLSKIGSEKAAGYANAILDFAERESLFASLSFFSAASLEERVISIMKNKTKRGHLPAVIAVFAAMLIIMTACGTAPKPEENAKPVSAGNTYSDSRILYLYPTSAQPMCYEGDEFFETYSNVGGEMIAGPESTEVFASAEGTVLKAVTDSEKLGNYIVINHADGNQTLYAFCGKILVTEGQKVSSGDVISEISTRIFDDEEGKHVFNYVYFQIIAGGGFDYASYGGEKVVDISTGEMSYQHSESCSSEDYCVSSGEVSEGQLDEIKTELAEKTDEELQNAINFVWPCESVAITALKNDYPGHGGIDIGTGNGLEIYAAADGIVTEAVWGNTGYGYYVVIDHGSGYQTLYAHCHEIFVEVGEEVVAGQIIATTGSTGNSTGAHLHFEVRVNGVYSDPLEFVCP